MQEVGSQLIIKPAAIHVDNQGAIKVAEENKSISDKSKPIDLQMFYLRENIQNGKVILKYINSADNLADSFANSIGSSKLNIHREQCCALDGFLII